MKRFACYIVALFAFSLYACGGGGDSSGTSPYTGITSAAAITAANADNIVLGAFEGGDAGVSFVGGPLGPSTDGVKDASTVGRPKALSLLQVLNEAAGKVLQGPSASGTTSSRAVVTESGTIDDGYGGTLTYTLSVDDQTGDFTGSFVFQNYHGESGEGISGPVSVTGTFNFATGTIDHLQYSFASLTMTDGLSSATVSGSIDLFDGNPATATENLFLTDNATGKTVWIDNLTVNVTEGAGYVDVVMSGKIYLADYGFVVVSTSTPFRYLAGSTNPSIGTMIVTGSSNGRARLTVIDATSFTIDVDADGDGTYEISTLYTWM